MSTLSCSNVSFSFRNWPRYRWSRYLHALFLMLSDHGKRQTMLVQEILQSSTISTLSSHLPTQRDPDQNIAHLRCAWRHVCFARSCATISKPGRTLPNEGKSRGIVFGYNLQTWQSVDACPSMQSRDARFHYRVTSMPVIFITGGNLP